MKKVIKIVVPIIALILICFIIFGLIVIFTGRGSVALFLDEDESMASNSIAERTFQDINGRKNGMIIRGKDSDNPVLLFISGGPGVPQYWLNEYYDNKIEDYYTVCWWEWAGEGMSYDAAMKPEDISMESLTKDAVSVAKYLKERLGKEKIYLMAHSGGTPLGLKLAQTDQDDFYCYFAMGQVIDQGEIRYRAGYPYLKRYFESTGNTKALKQLEQLMVKDKNGEMVPVNPKTIAGNWEQLLLSAGCGTTRKMRSDALGIFFPQMFSKCYTPMEKINFWRGKALNSQSSYSHSEVSTKEAASKIPIYFISGRFDYTCPVTLVEELYQNIEAPEKGLYIFEESAHSPLWEENETVLDVMRKASDKDMK
ncbi:MAG: alpha/beta hydrolase [Lachnospiraceae bacterium]|nr:alpha/beta hydrolase [Lachnospiraceae bacterium]